MKQFFLLFLFILLRTMLYSQAEPMAFEEWKTTSGTQNFFIKSVSKTDAYGNIYVGGATVNSVGNYDILLAKYNSSGVQLWIQQYAGAGNGTDFAGGLVVTDTYAILTGAVTTSTASPTTDIITMKYSSAGVFQWASTYDGTGNSFDATKHVVLDGSGNIYVTGASYNSSGNTDMVTIKYNSSGTQQWVSTYDYSANLDDAATKVVISGSNLTVTGPVTISANNYKLATLTYAQSTGSLTATNISTATTTSSITAVTDLTGDGANNNYIVGSTFVSGQGYNYYVQKLSANTLVSAWTYTYNGASNLDDIAKNVVVDASGNVYITGYSTSSTQGRDIVTIKLNSSGSFQWSQTINGALNSNDEASDMIIDASANLYITGYMTDGLNNMDYYTAKYNSSGTKLWEIQTDANHLNDQSTNIVLDSLNNVIVTGQTESALNTYNFTTVKYVQKDVITPTDFNGETPSANFMFYENKGQIIDTSHTSVSAIKFYSNYTNPAFYFKSNSQSFVFTKTDTSSINHKDTLHRIDLNFTNSLESAKTYPLEQQETGYLNYFLSHTGTSGITGVLANKRLITPNIYNNIDLMISSNQNGVKYYFIVKPGGDMRDIKLEFTGASSYSLNGTSNYLSINSSIGSLTFDKPVAYQLTAGNATIAVTSFSPTWTTDGASNKYKFNNGTYTSSLTLIIEVDQGNSTYSSTSSGNIKWSTYLGKTSADMINKIKTDNSNNLFALGQTYSSAFPQGNGVVQVYQPNNAGSVDGFISKFNPTGELIWSTYVGGTKNDNLNDVAFHSNGDLYCVGNTNSNDLNTVAKFGADNDATFDGPSVITELYYYSNEAYIFQLNQNGLTNPWLRYYGGSNYDGLYACAMNGNAFYITGYSYSTNIPVIYAASSYTQANVVASPWLSASDGIIARFDVNSVITWATYVGSSAAVTIGPLDRFYDIVFADQLDGGPPDFYVVGSSSGNNYPILTPSGSSTYTHGGLDDGIVTRFTNTGGMVWSTNFGGSDNDVGYALAYGNNKLYVTGHTFSSNFLSINSGNDYFQTYGNSGDAFFLKVNSNNSITHSTYLGGSDYDTGYDIVYHSATNTAYLSGQSRGPNFPIPSSNPVNTYNQSYGGAIDNFITALKDNNTSLVWSTYLGGTLDEFYYGINNGENHQAICIDGNSNLYLGGLTRTSQTQTNPFPLDNGGGLPTFYQPLIDGPMDATITKFDLLPVNVVSVNEYKLSDDIFIYPNPVSNNLFIKFNTKIQKASCKILNALGQVVYIGTINSDNSFINVAKLSAGFYVIELFNNDSKFSAKFIKHD